MGRKIPGKKHRGVKDPFQQHAQRLAVLKTKINKTPIRPDEQPIPRSLVQLMKWKDRSNNIQGKVSKTKHKVTPILEKKKSTDKSNSNPLKRMQRLDGESKKSFGARINEALKTLKGDTTFDDILKDVPKEMRKRENDSGRPFIKKKKNNKNEVRLTKSQKKTQREKEMKKQFKEEKEFDKLCEIKRDVVQFGEVAHEPPALKIKPKKAQVAEGAPRPARKDLLLNRIFDKNNSNSSNDNFRIVKDNALLKMKSDGVDLKVKRKNLPGAVRRKLEESQKEAMEAYKQIRQSQTKNNKI